MEQLQYQQHATLTPPQKRKGGTKEEDRKEEVKEDGLEEKRKGVKGTRRNGIRRQGRDGIDKRKEERNGEVGRK